MILKAFKTISAVKFQNLTTHSDAPTGGNRAQWPMRCLWQGMMNCVLQAGWHPLQHQTVPSSWLHDFAQSIPINFPTSGTQQWQEIEKMIIQLTSSKKEWHSLSGLKRAMQHQLFLDDTWSGLLSFSQVWESFCLVKNLGLEKNWTDHNTLSKASACKSHLVQFSMGFLKRSSGAQSTCILPHTCRASYEDTAPTTYYWTLLAFINIYFF